MRLLQILSHILPREEAEVAEATETGTPFDEIMGLIKEEVAVEETPEVEQTAAEEISAGAEEEIVAEKKEEDIETGKEIQVEEVEVPEDLSSLEAEAKEQKIDELVAKAETGELDPGEIAFLKAEGLEVQVFEAEGGEEKTPEEIEAEAEASKLEEGKFTPPAYAELVEEVFPDREFVSKEDYEKAVVDWATRETDSNRQLKEAIESDPEAGAILADFIKNKNLVAAIVANMDTEMLTKVDKDDPNYEAWLKAKLQREQKAEADKKLRDKFIENKRNAIELSSAYAQEKFTKDGKFDQNKTKEFFDQFDSILNELNEGRVTRRTLDIVFKGFGYDSALSAKEREKIDAVEAARIQGQNQRIVITRKKKVGGTPTIASPQSTVKGVTTKKYANPADEFLAKLDGGLL